MCEIRANSGTQGGSAKSLQRGHDPRSILSSFIGWAVPSELVDLIRAFRDCACVVNVRSSATL
jgi:hypothetical protein